MKATKVDYGPEDIMDPYIDTDDVIDNNRRTVYRGLSSRLMAWGTRGEHFGRYLPQYTDRYYTPSVRTGAAFSDGMDRGMGAR